MTELNIEVKVSLSKEFRKIHKETSASLCLLFISEAEPTSGDELIEKYGISDHSPLLVYTASSLQPKEELTKKLFLFEEN